MYVRFAIPLVLVACIGPLSSSPPAPDGGVAKMSCTPFDCTGVDCQLSTAETDRTLCPAFEQQCGGFTVITEMGTDTSTDHYYDGSGAIVAVVHESPVLTPTCSGPADFMIPTCTAPASSMLPVCATP
jgi:hypothetical protein